MGSSETKRKPDALPTRAVAAFGLFGIRISSIDIPSDLHPDLRTLIESEVWIDEDPDQMIHFNGEGFLGPYQEMTANLHQSHPRQPARQAAAQAGGPGI